MDWTPWARHFERNAHRPLPAVEPPTLDEPRRLALVTSLARFQLGESGEGRIAHDIDRVALPTIDDAYRRALKRFVAEEGRHARLLGQMVNALGGRLLERQWAERLFTHGRRALGVRFKLLVLMVAEVIGIAFYGLLSRALPASPMRTTLQQICADEEHHLRFHADFFRSQRSAWGASTLLWLAWWPLALVATLVVLFDHRAALKAFGVPARVAATVMLERTAQAGRLMRAAGTGAAALGTS